MSSQAGVTVGSRLERVAVMCGSTLAAINIWTGAPLLALWIGSQVASGSGLSLGAVFVVVASLAAFVIGLATALTRLSTCYDALTGRPPATRRTSPWLRSLRGEREELVRRDRHINAVERLVVLSVVACVIVFEFWFFFLAGSSLPNGGP